MILPVAKAYNRKKMLGAGKNIYFDAQKDNAKLI